MEETWFNAVHLKSTRTAGWPQIQHESAAWKLKNNGKGKMVFQNMVLGQLDNHMEKKTILTPDSHHTESVPDTL